MSVAVHATKADLPAVTTALTRAFLDDPVQRWAFDGAADFGAAAEAFMAFFVERYFRLGHMYVAGSVSGATLWAPPDRHALSSEDLCPLLELMRGHVGDEAEPRLTELGRSFEFLPEVPHFYLGIAGVDPAAQGRGLGGTLVAPGLRACDDGGFVAHLESSNPRNISFYERLGFEVVAQFTLGDANGPVMTPMTRQPRS